ALANASGLDANAQSPQKQIGACLAQMRAFQPLIQLAASAPVTIQQIAENIFASAPRSYEAARGFVRIISLARVDDPGNPDGVAPLPLRLHYFFHHAGRIWACINPECTGRTGTTPPGAEQPPVGKLFTEPRPICDACNSRVLELLYCEPCGEVF